MCGRVAGPTVSCPTPSTPAARCGARRCSPPTSCSSTGALHDHDLAEGTVDRDLERGRIVVLEGPSRGTRHLQGIDEERWPVAPAASARIRLPRSLWAARPRRCKASVLQILLPRAMLVLSVQPKPCRPTLRALLLKMDSPPDPIPLLRFVTGQDFRRTPVVVFETQSCTWERRSRLSRVAVRISHGIFWEEARNSVNSGYSDIQVLSFDSRGSTARKFSADTGVAECFVVATNKS